LYTAGKQGHLLKADNHEFDFEFLIPGDQFESIEGLRHFWLAYELRATVERGMMNKNLVAKKHIRIIRTFDPTALEVSQEIVSLLKS
jgi:arrestin-related trafficking adapter 4/5/7